MATVFGDAKMTTALLDLLMVPPNQSLFTVRISERRCPQEGRLDGTQPQAPDTPCCLLAMCSFSIIRVVSNAMNFAFAERMDRIDCPVPSEHLRAA